MKRLIKATMRNATLAGGLLIFCAATSCGKNEVERDTMTVDKAGSFNIDGSNFRGKSSVQKFGNGNYSILCEQDDPYKLIQITFHSQAEAETGGTFKVGDDILNIPAGQVNIGVDGLTFDPDGSFSVTVTGHKIVASGIKLIQTGGGSKKFVIKSASIEF